MASYACKNVRYLRKLRGWTQDEFANKLKIKRSLLGAYEEERAEPKLDVLKEITKMFKISLEELLLKDLTLDKSGESYIDRRRALKNGSDSAPLSIPFVPVKAAAGYLGGYADPEFMDELNTFTLPMITHGDYRAFEIVGDSMLPTPSGSVVIGEKLEQLNDVKNDDPYVVVSKAGGIVFKRINRNNRKPQVLTLVSDNTIFEPYQIEVESLLELWHVKYIISKTTTQHRWDVNHLAGVVNSLQEQVSSLKKKMK